VRTTPTKPEGSTTKASTLRGAKPYLDAAWIMTGSVVVGVLTGYFLDRWLHTKPYLFLAGSLLGLIGGFTGFILVILRMNRPADRT
jgi:F0F1-type ATP synthase assembly protein I